jgi:hypothetical protein
MRHSTGCSDVNALKAGEVSVEEVRACGCRPFAFAIDPLLEGYVFTQTGLYWDPVDEPAPSKDAA